MTAENPFHPLANSYPLLKGRKFAAFVEDIRKNGFRLPVWRYKGLIIDGRNRYLAGLELGKKPPEEEYAGTEEDLAEFIESLNDHRRHMSGDEIDQAKKERSERIARVAEAAQNGESIRAIAESEGVSPTQVREDIKAATVQGAQSHAENVKGRDGRKVRRGSLKKKAAAEAREAIKRNEAAKNGTAEAAPLTDSVDQEVPAGLVPVFSKVEEFKAIVNQLNAINRKLQELKESPAGSQMRLQNAQIDLKNLKETVRFDTPYAVCPVCKGIAKTRKANCPCKQLGWLVETSYKNLPAEYRQ